MDLLGGALLAPTPSGGSDGAVPLQPRSLLKKVVGRGLSVEYSFSRQASSVDPAKAQIVLKFTNESPDTLTDISFGANHCGLDIDKFSPIAELAASAEVEAILAVDFQDKISSVSFDIVAKEGDSENTFKVSLEPTIGELMHGFQLSLNDFDKEFANLGGLNASSATVDLNYDSAAVTAKIVAGSNFTIIPSEDPLKT